MNAMFDACARLGELRVLGEEAVARMNRVGAGDLGGGDDARNLEVRVARGRRADADIVIREAHVQRFAVGFGVDGHGLDAELAARADDAQRDLAAVRDQDFLEHAAGAVGLTVSGRLCRERERHAPRQSVRSQCSKLLIGVDPEHAAAPGRVQLTARCLLEPVPARVARPGHALHAKRKLARVARVEERALVRDDALRVPLHERLVEALHAVLDRAFLDQIRDVERRVEVTDLLAHGGGVDEHLARRARDPAGRRAARGAAR